MGWNIYCFKAQMLLALLFCKDHQCWKIGVMRQIQRDMLMHCLYCKIIMIIITRFGTQVFVTLLKQFSDSVCNKDVHLRHSPVLLLYSDLYLAISRSVRFTIPWYVSFRCVGGRMGGWRTSTFLQSVIYSTSTTSSSNSYPVSTVISCA